MLQRSIPKPNWLYLMRATQIGWSIGTTNPRTPVKLTVVKLKFDKLGGIDFKLVFSTFSTFRFVNISLTYMEKFTFANISVAYVSE